MTYLLDANVFIQAKNLHYGLDFCPAFWDWIDKNNAAGRVFSIDKVGDEIAAGEDELRDWMQQRQETLLIKTTQRVVEHFGRVSTWATQQGYDASAVTMFFQVADYYLIAHALAGPYVVVTHEVPSNSIRKIKIPNVCMGLGLRCVTPYEMLRVEQARFVLGSR